MKYLDYVNVMTYDMGAAPDGHNSPLYRSAKFDQRSCDESIDLHAKAGIPLSWCEGERYNLKITTKEDLRLAEALLHFQIWKGTDPQNPESWLR